MNQTSLKRNRAVGVLLAAAAILGPLSGVYAGDQKVLTRDKIPTEYKWATELIYPSEAAWEKDFETIGNELDKLAAFEGKLGTDAETLLAFFKLRDDIVPRFEKVYVYASLKSSEDTRDSDYQAMIARLRTLIVKFSSTMAWVSPELTSIPWETIEKWMGENEDLALYRHSLHDTFRQKQYVLSPEKEELIALAGQMRSTASNAYSLLTNADIKFPTIKDEDGNDFELYEQAFYKFMRSPDRRVRKDAYDGIVGTFSDFRNTAAALLGGQVQNHLFTVKARGYESCLQASLDGGNVPVKVYNNLIDTVNDNLPLLHRYMKIRRDALGLTDGVHAYDLFAPMTAEASLEYSYEEAIDLMMEALKPLGPKYCAAVDKGVKSRWIDAFATKGKRSGAFSSGTYLTQPFILLNFSGGPDQKGGYEEVSTLVHEMGHSMHSYMSRGTQPYVYADYDIFCAEVASITNEVLLQDYVLKQIKDPQTKLFLLVELLEGFRGTVFRQTMFSEYEQKIHEMAEQGIPLTADTMGAAYGKIMKKYYGPEYVHDELVDDYWIRIPHFYYDFYVYKYATSYCAASNIAERILAGEPGAVEAYMEFLSAGGHKYPVDVLKLARVDMTTPEPIEAAMKQFERLLDETEALLKEQGKLAAK